MPAPEKKISAHNEDSLYEIKLACSVEVEGKGNNETSDATKAQTSDKAGSSDPCKKGGSAKDEAGAKKKCSATSVKIIKESQAQLNKEPCPNETGSSCQMPRPDLSATTTRIDKTKPGCIDFESCEDDKEDKKKENKPEKQGCIDYEDCNDFAEEEKRRLKQKKEDEKRKRRENKK